jgi:hypothetical protein
MRPAPVLAAALIAGGIGLIAAAPAAEARSVKSERACFYASNVRGFTAVDNRVMNIEVGANDIYRFNLMGGCPDIDFANGIALVSKSSNFICAGIDAEIVYRGPGGPQRCLISNIRKLTPAEAKALPRKEQP